MSDGTCTAKDCDGPVLARSMCSAHYQQWWRRADPADFEKPPPKRCSAKDCDSPAHARGLCTGHYKREVAGLPLDTPLRVRRKRGEPPAACSVEDCDEPSRKLGLCRGHYWRSKSGAPLDGALRAKRKNGEGRPPAGQCAYEGCDRNGSPQKRGFCTTHYTRHLAGEPMDAPIRDQVSRIGTCAAPDCDREIWSRGLCVTCYARVYLVESGKAIEYAATRLHRMLDGPHERITAADRRALRAATADCYLCGEPLADPVEFDHVIPLARGGHHVLANIKPTHKRCNRRKHTSLPDEFAQALLGEGVMS